MRKVLLGVGALVAVGAIAAGAFYFKTDLFHGASRGPATAEQSGWIVSPPPPAARAARIKTMFSVIKPFGAWHLMCVRLDQAAQSPPPGRCQVGIRMQNAAAPNQTMFLGFRYRSGAAHPEVFVLYVTLGRPNISISPMGQFVDLDKKEKPRPGQFLGQFASRNAGYQDARAQDVHLQLAGRNLAVPTAICRHAHCVAHYLDADFGQIGTGAKIVVRLPGPPRGTPRTVDVPSDGLSSALAELRRVSGV